MNQMKNQSVNSKALEHKMRNETITPACINSPRTWEKG